MRLLNAQKKMVPIFLAQQIPKPTVHAALRLGARFANLKRVRSIVFEESRGPDELERKRFPLADKGGVSQNDFQCSSQPWRIRKFRVNLFVLPFGDCIGIPNAHNYLICKKGGSNFITIHELLQYSSRIVTVAFVYDKSPEGKANQAFWNARAFKRPDSDFSTTGGAPFE